MASIEEVLDKLEPIIAKEINDEKKAEEIINLLCEAIEADSQTTMAVITEDIETAQAELMRTIRDHRHLDDGSVVLPLN